MSRNRARRGTERPAVELGERRKQRPFHHLVGEVGATKGRASRRHAAGVRSRVAVERALVVLRSREHPRPLPVAEREERDLRSGQTLFDDARAAGVAERRSAEIRPHCVARLRERLGDDDPLPDASPSVLTT